MQMRTFFDHSLRKWHPSLLANVQASVKALGFSLCLLFVDYLMVKFSHLYVI